MSSTSDVARKVQKALSFAGILTTAHQQPLQNGSIWNGSKAEG